MTLTYQANLDDLTETQLRFFKTTRSYQKQRIISTILALLIAPALSYGIFRFLSDQPNLLIVLIFGIIVPVWVYLGHEKFVADFIRKQLKTEVGDQLPTPATLTISQNEFSCECLDVGISFPLGQLDSVSEDEERVELRFGKLGLCTIPHRAFTAVTQKSEFLEAVWPGRRDSRSTE